MISICVPAYKQPEFLKRTLQSVIIQTYEDYEVIITDDSPDTAVEEAVTPFLHDKRFKYYRNSERKGSPGNWNEAIDLASGEYIKILHHDDWFTYNDSLKKFLALLENNEAADFAFSSTNVCDAAQQIKYLHCPTDQQLIAIKNDPLFLFTGNFIGAPSATIFRKKTNVKFDNKLRWIVDIDYYINFLKDNPVFCFNKEPLICTTSGAAHQITSECYDNKQVEIYEWIYLYEKIRTKYGINYNMVKSVWGLLRRYHVSSIAEIYECGIDFKIPYSIKLLTAFARYL
jgi:glycosyltransferase involved in cell wall biosynthesis